MAYRMLTGALPFPGPRAVEIVRAMLARNFLPPSHHAPDLGPSVDAFFAHAFKPGLDRPFGDAVHFSEQLASALDLNVRSSTPVLELVTEPDTSLTVREEAPVFGDLATSETTVPASPCALHAAMGQDGELPEGAPPPVDRSEEPTLREAGLRPARLGIPARSGPATGIFDRLESYGTPQLALWMIVVMACVLAGEVMAHQAFLTPFQGG
jgi:hypothetical protein